MFFFGCCCLCQFSIIAINIEKCGEPPLYSNKLKYKLNDVNVHIPDLLAFNGFNLISKG